MKKRAWWGVVFLCIVLAAGLFGSSLPSKGIQQPVPFNHKKHQEMGYSCDLCHSLVETHTQAGRPTIATCQSCHLSLETENPLARQVKELAEKGKEIPWARLYTLPDYVFFSHRRHVTLAKLECSVCHGKIGESEMPPKQVAVQHTMASCIACHQKMKASIDCLSCHK